MIRELTTQEKFKDIRLLAHNLKLAESWKELPYVYNRLTKIVSICDEQIETINEIVNDHAMAKIVEDIGERNA